MLKSIVTLSLVLVVSACGRKADDEGKANSLDLLLDVQVASDVAAAQLDEAISSLSEGSFNTLALNAAGNFETTRSCETSGTAATVNIQSQGSSSSDFERGPISVSRSVEGTGKQTRVWKQEGASIGCNGAKTGALVDWLSTDGLSLSQSFERNRSVILNITNTRNGNETSRERTYSASGERNILWTGSSESENGSLFVTEKTISSRVLRKANVTNKKGETSKFQFEIATDSAAPLQVETVRQKSDRALVSRTIVSGTLVANSEGNTLVAQFSNLKFVASSGKCVPDSGSISGGIYAAGSDEAKQTFAVQFEEGVPTFTAGSESVELPVPACDPEDE